MKLSIVVPAYNEEENIVDVINEIEETVDTDCELVIINDHSTDSTSSLVKGLQKKYKNISLYDNQESRGFANAVKAGLEKAAGDYVVPVMGDLCDDLETIKKMVEKLDQGYDVVCGCRYMTGGGRLGGSGLKAFLSRYGGITLHFLLGIPTHDIANAFKMYRKKILKDIIIESQGFEISMEIPLKAYYNGAKVTEVATVWRERTKGSSSFKVFRLLPRYLGLYLWAIAKRLLTRLPKP